MPQPVQVILRQVPQRAGLHMVVLLVVVVVASGRVSA
jgi:hypothetical protein